MRARPEEARGAEWEKGATWVDQDVLWQLREPLETVVELLVGEVDVSAQVCVWLPGVPDQECVSREDAVGCLVLVEQQQRDVLRGVSGRVEHLEGDEPELYFLLVI